MNLEQELNEILDAQKKSIQDNMGRSKDLSEEEIAGIIPEVLKHDIEQYKLDVKDRKWFTKDGSAYIVFETDDGEGKYAVTGIPKLTQSDNPRLYFVAKFPLMEEPSQPFPTRISIFVPEDQVPKTKAIFNKRVMARGKITEKYMHVDDDKKTEYSLQLNEFLKHLGIKSLSDINANQYRVYYQFNMKQKIKVIQA